MSEHITHVAVYEDTVRLVKHFTLLNDVFRNALNSQYDSGMICSGSRGNHLYAVPILEKFRKKVKARKLLTEEDNMKIAGALGWITHRASDLTVKPLFRAVEAENKPQYDGQVYSIYHDVTSYKNVYNNGKRDNLSPFEYFSTALMKKNLAPLQASEAFYMDKLEQIMSFYWVKEFVNLHTSATDVNTELSDENIQKLFQSMQEFTEVWTDYIDAFNNPKNNRIEKYLTKPDFYDSDDIIIKVARAYQENRKTDITYKTAMNKENNASHYAKILQKSIRFLNSADRFFTSSSITPKELSDLLEM